MKKKLKIGLMIDEYDLPAWAYRSVERISLSLCAELALIIVNEYPKTISRHGGVKGIYSLFDMLDRKVFRRLHDAEQQIDIRPLLRGIPEIKAKAFINCDKELFEQADVAVVKEHGLDIIIKFGFGLLRGEILQAAKYGIWSHHHGGAVLNSGDEPPGFWEVVLGIPETGSILHILRDGEGCGKVIFRSWSMTSPLSPSRNRNALLWASSSFAPREINKLYHLGEERFFSEAEKYALDIEINDRPAYPTLTNTVAIGLLSKQLLKLCRKAASKFLTYEQWHLSYRISDGVSSELNTFKSIVPPRDRFWADPFIINTDGKYFIFIEELVYKSKKAHISVFEVDDNGNYSTPVPILETDYHLSYPYVFQWEGVYYMIPESLGNKTIELYECLEFPHTWQFKMNIMEDVLAVDTTLLHRDGKWWLFAGMIENEGASLYSELFLFFADDLFAGVWQPHPLNPIVSDVKNARPAGRIFTYNEKTYRPSQNCSGSYGYGFNINEIIMLSETEYSERLITSAEPNWQNNLIGTHTFQYERGLTMVDVLRKRNKLLQYVSK